MAEPPKEENAPPIRFKHRLEYSVLRFFSIPFQWLPYRMALGLAWILAWIGFHLVRFRRTEAVARIGEVFGDKYSEKEKHRIAWISWRNIVFSVAEMTRLPRINRAFIDRYLVTDKCVAQINADRAAGSENGGAILALPHIGNWEVAGIACNELGVPLFTISRKQKNPLVTDYIWRLRNVAGGAVLDRDHPAVVKQAVRKLKDGGVLAFLADLRNRRPGGNRYDFLGAKAHIVEGAPMMAWLAKVPLLPIVVRRDGWTRQEWIPLETVFLDFKAEDKKAEQQRALQNMLTQFDAYIREHPEQYFWINKRWVLEPHAEAESEA